MFWILNYSHLQTFRGASFSKNDVFLVLKPNCDRQTWTSFMEALLWKNKINSQYTESMALYWLIHGQEDRGTHKGSLQLEECSLRRHVEGRQRWSDADWMVMSLKRKHGTEPGESTPRTTTLVWLYDIIIYEANLIPLTFCSNQKHIIHTTYAAVIFIWTSYKLGFQQAKLRTKVNLP